MRSEAGFDRGGARLTERLSERVLSRGPGPEKQFRISVLRDVAWGPMVETGANVPSYSGGGAAWLVVSDEGCGCFL